MPGNVGWQGLVVILIILLLVFGPKRLPEMGRSLGRGMREFKDSITGNDLDDEHAERVELESQGQGETVERSTAPTKPESEHASR